jgi:hypothetical protein
MEQRVLLNVGLSVKQIVGIVGSFKVTVHDSVSDTHVVHAKATFNQSSYFFDTVQHYGSRHSLELTL